MVKTVFYACSAWVGRIDGETRCRFWSQNPLENNFDHKRLVSVDLAMSPAGARKGSLDWAKIQVDDVAEADGSGGLTTIGPWFPDGRTTGAIYLAEPYWKSLKGPARPVFPPPGFDAPAYEFMTVVHKDGPRAGKRYIGMHARIVQERGAKVSVEFLFSCSPRVNKAAPPYKFDLASMEVEAHVSEGGLTEVGVGNRKKEGALFVEFTRAKALGIVALKLPASCGFIAVDGRRVNGSRKPERTAAPSTREPTRRMVG